MAWWAFDPAVLATMKEDQGLRVSVCLPARNEGATVGEIVAPIRRRLVSSLRLVDELVVIDDGSEDDTASVALAAGAEVFPVETLLPDEAPGHGKGNVIWRSLSACTGDLVCWVDADIRNFELHFITGLLGPLLTDPDIAFVKGHYRRPLDGQPSGGGRVSELVARPLLSRFFPELASFAQPLAGEYAARRSLLETLPMVEGWGVEIGLLIDAWRAVGMPGLAQVDLGVREHRNRPLDELALPAMEILLTVLQRAGVTGLEAATVPELIRFAGEAGVSGVPVPFAERLPMRTRAGYHPAAAGPRLQAGAACDATARVPSIGAERVVATDPRTLSPPGPPGPARATAGDATELRPPDPAPTGVDPARVARAVAELLHAIGEDPTRDGLRRTPERVAGLYLELCAGLHDDPGRHLGVRFQVDHDELVLVRDIAFSSLCEHHLLPFIGRAHVGYVPGVDGRVTGLSKLARLVDGFARRPQLQERLTTQVADAIEERLRPRGAVVVIEAEHLCLTMQGVRTPGALTITSAVRGILRHDAGARAEVMSVLHGRPANRTHHS